MSEPADGDRRKLIAGALMALAGLTAPLFGDRALPALTTVQAQFGLGASLALAAFGVLLITSTLWKSASDSKPRQPRRQWATVGFGQGWIEHRVRNNEGAEFGVGANPGAGADKISLEISFPKRTRSRTSDQIELVLEIDERTFEFFVNDQGTAAFSLTAQVWRDLEAFRQVVAALRRGKLLWVTVVDLDLSAEFTLDGAYDILAEIEAMDDAET